MEYLDGEKTFKTTDKGMNFMRIKNKVQGLNPLTTKSQRNDSPSHDAIILTENIHLTPLSAVIVSHTHAQ
jgi:hypothetical protein